MSSYRGYNSLEPGSAEGGNGAKKLAMAKKSVSEVSRVVVLGTEEWKGWWPSCSPVAPPPLSLLADFSLLFYPIFCLFPTVESVPRLGL